MNLSATAHSSSARTGTETIASGLSSQRLGGTHSLRNSRDPTSSSARASAPSPIGLQMVQRDGDAATGPAVALGALTGSLAWYTAASGPECTSRSAGSADSAARNSPSQLTGKPAVWLMNIDSVCVVIRKAPRPRPRSVATTWLKLAGSCGASPDTNRTWAMSLNAQGICGVALLPAGSLIQSTAVP